MFKRFLLIAVAPLLLYAGNDADTSDSRYGKVTKKRYKNYIGIAGGSTTGFGVSYRRWFGPQWGAQLNLFPFYYENTYEDKDRDSYYYTRRDSGYSNTGMLSFGLTGLRSIADAKYVRFLAYFGSNVLINYEKYNYHQTRREWEDTAYVYTEGWYKGKDQSNTISIGGGCGSEFYVWRFGFHLMLGLRVHYETESEAKGVGPTAEGGVHFRF